MFQRLKWWFNGLTRTQRDMVLGAIGGLIGAITWSLI
jgi:hypothetical protein